MSSIEQIIAALCDILHLIFIKLRISSDPNEIWGEANE